MMKACVVGQHETWKRSVLLCYTYSTEAAAARRGRDTLYGRLLEHGNPKICIEPILEEWVSQGNPLEPKPIAVLIKQLRKFKRYSHALQVSEWMSNKRYFDLSPGDVAIRLDLISKARGLEQAENYFNSLPSTLRNFQVYGALLNCYAHSNSLEKAEATMQTLRTLGYANKAILYNVMLNLYARMGMHEKLDPLIKEMEEKGITADKYTLNMRLHAYVTASDVEGMERLLTKMETNSPEMRNWHFYVVASNGYLKIGDREKAYAMLKKSEQLVRPYKNWFAYEVLLTLYASLGDKKEVLRLWKLYKKTGKAYNMGYLSMISSLAKLDDLDGAEQILAEWENLKKKTFDGRLPTALINAYCKKGNIGKAESIICRILESGEEVNATTWERMVALYLEHDQIDKAIDSMKKAISKVHLRMSNFVTFAHCLECLKGRGNTEKAKELIDLMREKSFVGEESCEKLLEFVISKETTTLDAFEILEVEKAALRSNVPTLS